MLDMGMRCMEMETDSWCLVVPNYICEYAKFIFWWREMHILLLVSCNDIVVCPSSCDEFINSICFMHIAQLLYHTHTVFSVLNRRGISHTDINSIRIFIQLECVRVWTSEQNVNNYGDNKETMYEDNGFLCYNTLVEVVRWIHVTYFNFQRWGNRIDIPPLSLTFLKRRLQKWKVGAAQS